MTFSPLRKAARQFLAAFCAVLLGSAAGTRAQFVGQNVNVSRMAADKTEPAVVIDPTNPARVFIAANIQFGNGLMAAYSTDWGDSWTYTDTTDGVIADGSDGLPDSCCDASVSAAADAFGNIFLVYLKTAAPAGIVVALSTNGGQGFSHVATLAAGHSVDQPSVATGCDPDCSSGSVWVTFKDYARDGTPVMACGAPVTGLGLVGAFEEPQDLPGSSAGNFGDIAVGPAGQVMVTFQSVPTNAGPDSIFVCVDPDGLGPAGFGTRILATATDVGTFSSLPAQPDRGIDAAPGLAFDITPGSPYLGRAYLVYTDHGPGGGSDTDILVRYSDDAGATWSLPRRVNNDLTTRSQFFPRIALDPTSGNLAVSWYDCRHDFGVAGPDDRTPGPNNDTQFYAAISTDGGQTWPANIRVSAGVSSQAASDNPNDYGEYSALAFHGRRLQPVWSDNSNSTGDNPGGSTSFDIYTARVALGLGLPLIRPVSAVVTVEECQPANGAIDPGESVTLEVTLENAGDNDAGAVTATLLPWAGVLNPGPVQNYGLMLAGDAPVSRSFTFTGNGACGRLVQATFEINNGPVCLGTTSIPLPVGVVSTNRQTFANPAAIAIIDRAEAAIYPSAIEVAGLTSAVERVTVMLHELAHSYAADLDLLVVGPGGQAVMLMSDAGGSEEVQGTITFDDGAAPLPKVSQIDPGTYAPTDHQDLFDDALPPPAPSAPFGGTLAVFKGTDPNGAWKLFIMDDGDGDQGALHGGWSLTFLSTATNCCGVIPPPKLSISLDGATLRLTWPASANGFTLVAKTTLDPNTPWAPVTNPVVPVNGLNSVSVPATGQSRFFRLMK